MRKFRLGQLWLVNFDPSFGHKYKKVRPALIIEGDEYIETSSLSTVVPLSSQTEKQSTLDFLLKKDDQNRLMKDSLIKMKQLNSFDKRRFIKYIGEIDEKTMIQIEDNLRSYFHL